MAFIMPLRIQSNIFVAFFYKITVKVDIQENYKNIAIDLFAGAHVLIYACANTGVADDRFVLNDISLVLILR